MADKKKQKMVEKKAKKVSYQQRLLGLFDQYEKILLVQIDNVGAYSIQQIRQTLRKEAVVLFGKNTLIRKTVRDYVEKCNAAGNKDGARIETLLPSLRGNVGLIFTNGDLSHTKEVAESFKQKAPAKVGAIAPEDVFVEPGPTGMEPTQTAFLQALNIASKIVKGQVEIMNRIHLVKAGEKVGSSEATLLDKLNIMPFSYRAAVITVYDGGFVYPASLLSLGQKEVLETLSKAIQRLSVVGLQIGFPCIATIPHFLANAYKDLISTSIEIDYEFEGSKDVKAFLKDPSAFAVAAPTTTTTVTETSKPVESKPVVEEKEEESQSIGGLFGSDD